MNIVEKQSIILHYYQSVKKWKSKKSVCKKCNIVMELKFEKNWSTYNFVRKKMKLNNIKGLHLILSESNWELKLLRGNL